MDSPPNIPAKRDRRSLPFGLKRYQPGEFERIHAAGSGKLTASSVAAMFGVSPYAGPYAQAAHIAGKAALPEVTSNLADWGGELEQLVLRKIARDRGWCAEPLRAYAKHPDLPRLLASPDGLIWKPEENGQFNWDAPGLSEIKVVNEPTYKEQWEIEPPVYTQLQVQSQFSVTRAASGIIGVLVLGAYTRRIEVWETLPDPSAIGMIEAESVALFALLDAGKLPPPDPHPTSLDALHRIYPRTLPGLTVVVPGGEAAERFDRWRKARQARLDAEKVEDTEKGWFASSIDPMAGLIQLDGGRRIVCKTVERSAYTRVVEAGTSRRWDLKSD